MTDRLETSLRLKAARHLAGRKSDKGRAIPLPVDELAQRPLLRDNGISANRIEEIEQMKTDARPMELEKIALALGLPGDWFTAPVARPPRLSAEELRALLEQALADLDQDAGRDRRGSGTWRSGMGPSSPAAAGGRG